MENEQIFLQKHSIIKYKVKGDFWRIDDFYGVYDRACNYVADCANPSLAEGEVGIMLICDHYPHKLMHHLQYERRFWVERPFGGVYRICGDFIAIVIVVASEVDGLDEVKT